MCRPPRQPDDQVRPARSHAGVNRTQPNENGCLRQKLSAEKLPRRSARTWSAALRAVLLPDPMPGEELCGRDRPEGSGTMECDELCCRLPSAPETIVAAGQRTQQAARFVPCAQGAEVQPELPSHRPIGNRLTHREGCDSS